jgi:phage N-6-adenine-methyltransferase
VSHFAGQYKTDANNIRDEYRTPDWLFDLLDGVFRFNLDAAATEENAKCATFFTDKPDDGVAWLGNPIQPPTYNDGLITSWEGRTAFINPPFTDGKYADWISKAVSEHFDNAVTSAMILPFNPETQGFRLVWETAHYLVLPYKRVNFLNPHGEQTSGINFLACVAIWTYSDLGVEKMQALAQLGFVLDLHSGLHYDELARSYR